VSVYGAVLMATTPIPLMDTDLALSANVTVLVGAQGGKYPDGNATQVVGTHGALVIDPSLTVHQRGGTPASVDRVLVSHAHEDHISGIGALGSDVSVHIHEDDLIGVQSIDGLMTMYGMTPTGAAVFQQVVERDYHYAARPDATGFADGEQFDLGGVTVTVLHLAGHTRGHCGFLVEPDGVAFVGDIDLSSFGPYYGDHWSNLDDFVRSLAKVRELDARHYVTFHHKGVVSGRAEFVAQLDRFASVIDQRDDRLLTLLDRPRTLDELVAHGFIYRPGTQPPGGESIEARSLVFHLDRLAATGHVTHHEGHWHRT
jgi:glyoxylase-like metal-dependent hydrolase (beta-lactamase superfamily II)